MSFLELARHLLAFAAPAAVVALLVPLGARLAMAPLAARTSWRACVAINFVVGLAVLGGGLVVFGHDGKMATYAALVLGVASAQWLAGRAWRG